MQVFSRCRNTNENSLGNDVTYGDIFHRKDLLFSYFFCTFVSRKPIIITTMKELKPTDGRMELAQVYFPDICPRSAWSKLKEYMADYPELVPLYTMTRRTFLPIELDLIFNSIGRPSSLR